MYENQEFTYELKPSLISYSEKPFLDAVKEAVPAGYIVQPQVNLASIIDKKGSFKYQNELFRNIDIGIFYPDYKPLALIEINDMSHNDQRRQERDKKVKLICEEAGIQLITLWTKYGVNQKYITDRVNQAILAAPTVKRIPHPKNTKEPEQAGMTVQSALYQYEQDMYAGNTVLEKPRDRDTGPQKKKGCYIATAVYGSYDCPNVWVFRRYRDIRLQSTLWGRIFIRSYYAVSPAIVKLFGGKRYFNSFCKKRLDKLADKLRCQGYSDDPYNDK